MPIFKLGTVLPILATLFFSSCQSDTTTVETADGPQEISSDEFLKIIGEAYVYGYPLVLMDLTKKVSTNIEAPHPEKASAPINQLGHFRNFPDHTLTAIVKPNVDTYYSIAWLDLAKEPQVLSVPATDRYYLLPFYDAYSNVFASPGTRTTGTGAQTFLIAGPNWEGEVPDSFLLIQTPTEMVWMLGRIQVNSPEDGATTVRAIQDGMKLVPLSAYGQHYSPPAGIVDPKHAEIVPVMSIRELDIETYLNKMAELMVQNPPKPEDSLMVQKMAKIGLVPGQPFQLLTDNIVLNTKLKHLPEFVHGKMEDRRAQPVDSLIINGWVAVTEGIGAYGTDYLRRAYIDFIGLGANLPEDAIYPNCTFDADGNRLDARFNYKLHFDADELPPVHAFWSLTAYNADEFLMKNDLNRFARGDRDALGYNSDGSLDLYIQSQPPEKERMSNWLPIPDEGPFFLTMRLYWPKEEVMNGTWEIPAVELMENKD